MVAEELALQVENKKLIAIGAIDDFASALRSVYADALTELEKQNLLLVASEADYAREIKQLAIANSDLLSALEIETNDHKKTLSTLAQRTAELDGVKKELEYSRKKIADLMDMVDSLTGETGKKTVIIEDLQQKLETLEKENDSLSVKAQRLKEYVGKSTSAYSQVANDELLKRKLPPIDSQEPSTTTT